MNSSGPPSSWTFTRTTVLDCRQSGPNSGCGLPADFSPNYAGVLASSIDDASVTLVLSDSGQTNPIVPGYSNYSCPLAIDPVSVGGKYGPIFVINYTAGQGPAGSAGWRLYDTCGIPGINGGQPFITGNWGATGTPTDGSCSGANCTSEVPPQQPVGVSGGNPLTDQMFLHEAGSTPNPLFAIVSPAVTNEGPGSCSGKPCSDNGYYWEIGTTNTRICLDVDCSGHSIKGYLNECAGKSFACHGFHDPAAPDQDLLTGPLAVDFHTSYNNDQSQDYQPAFGFTTSVCDTQGTPGGAPTNACAPYYTSPYSGEVIAIQNSVANPSASTCDYGNGPTGCVYRFAHSFCTFTSWNFDVQNCIGTVGSSGAFALITSDWNRTLGCTNGWDGNPGHLCLDPVSASNSTTSGAASQVSVDSSGTFVTVTAANILSPGMYLAGSGFVYANWMNNPSLFVCSSADNPSCVTNSTQYTACHVTNNTVCDSGYFSAEASYNAAEIGGAVNWPNCSAVRLIHAACSRADVFVVNLNSAQPALGQTITFAANAPASAPSGSSFTVAASASSGLAVVFTSAGSCTNSGATYSMTSGVGTCSVIANQAGNSTYSAAPQVTQTVNATLLSQTITFTTNAPASAAYNTSFTVAATASSGLAVVFTSAGSCTNSGPTYTMTAASGACSVIANQAGNSSYAAAPPVTEMVNAAALTQTITFTTNAPASAAYKSSFTVAATASSGLAVVFTSAGSCTNSGSTYTMTAVSGTCSVIANQAGNSNYAAAPQVTESVNATPGSQTITFTKSPPASAAYNSSFKVAATGGASGNPVVFTSAGSCSNSGTTYTMTSGTGTCSVIANQAGSADYAPAPQVTLTVNATALSQTIKFTTNAPASAVYNDSFTVAANGGASGNAVVFTSAGSCSNSGATYTMTSGTGSCSVIANQPGNADYSAATQVTETSAATPATPVASFTGAPATAPYGSIFMLTASSNSGVTPTVTASGACTISGATVTIIDGTGTCTATAKWAANADYSAVTLTQTTTAEKAVPVISWATPSAISYGTALGTAQLDATASYNGTALPGAFTYTPAKGAILGAGSQTLSVTFAPTSGSNYASSTDSVILVVNQISTATTITSISPTSPTAGTSVKVSFTVSASYSHPTGTVTINSSGGQTCTGTLSSGKGTCSITFSTAGSYTLTAAYGGDGNDLPSSTTTPFSVTVAK